MTILTFIFAYLLSALLVIALTPIVKAKALELGMLDQPCSRKVHSKPIVRLGGVAIFISCSICLLLGWISAGLAGEGLEGSILPLVFGGGAVFLLGLVDDWLSLSPILRLCCQLLISALVWQFGLRVDLSFVAHQDLPEVGLQCLSCLVTMLWLTGMTNAVNWIDGLDGLATGVCIIAASCLAFVGVHEGIPEVVYFSLCLLGALSGFLRYNFHPAQIFMGDSGSCFLGFTLAGLCLAGPTQVGSWRGEVVAIAVIALPLLDMIMVIGSRIIAGKSPFQADRSHLHHRLLSVGFPHRVTVEIIYLIAFLLSSTLLVIASYISFSLYALLLMAAISVAILRILASKSVNGLLSLASETN